MPVEHAGRSSRSRSKDVDHDWWVPALGAEDRRASPGRTNTPGSRPTRIGTFDGQCAEFCGIGHAGMLITVKVVSQSDWDSQYKDKADLMVTEAAPAASGHRPARDRQQPGGRG